MRCNWHVVNYTYLRCAILPVCGSIRTWPPKIPVPFCSALRQAPLHRRVCISQNFTCVEPQGSPSGSCRCRDDAESRVPACHSSPLHWRGPALPACAPSSVRGARQFGAATASCWARSRAGLRAGCASLLGRRPGVGWLALVVGSCVASRAASAPPHVPTASRGSPSPSTPWPAAGAARAYSARHPDRCGRVPWFRSAPLWWLVAAPAPVLSAACWSPQEGPFRWLARSFNMLCSCKT